LSTAGHEPPGNVTLDQAPAVLGEHRFVPYLGVQRQRDKPAEQQIVVELLHQLQFRAHRIERLQQQCAKQSLRGIDGRPSLAYSFSNSGDSAASASSTICRIGRNG
jgi:hypothetical protein